MARVERVRVGFRFPAMEKSRVSPPHRPREDGLAHPVDTSRSNLAAALGLLSVSDGVMNVP